MKWFVSQEDNDYLVMKVGFMCYDVHRLNFLKFEVFSFFLIVDRILSFDIKFWINNMTNAIVQPLYITTVIKFSLLTTNLLRMPNKTALNEVFKCIIRTCQMDDVHLLKIQFVLNRSTHFLL